MLRTDKLHYFDCIDVSMIYETKRPPKKITCDEEGS
jgi:hypothetical protein